MTEETGMIPLPPELQEQLEKQAHSGISYSRPRAPGVGMRRIYWQRLFNGIPVDPDALAEAIIAKVGEQEVQLDLDGHKFLIRAEET